MEITTPLDYEKRQRHPRRSLRPCDACRKRKTRCLEKDQPGDKCVHCELRGTTCSFRQGPPRRGEQHNQRRINESRAEHHVNAVSRSAPTPSPAPGDVRATPPALTNLTSSPHLQPAATPTAQVVPGSGGQEALQPHSVLLENASDLPTLGMARHRFAELYGLGSDMEPILMRYRPYDPQTLEYHLETHAIRRVTERDQSQQYPLTFHVVSDEKAAGHELAGLEADAIEDLAHPHGACLVELFWRNVQPSFPLLYKEEFMRCYTQSYKSISPELLGAVYLSALRWWSYDPELSLRPSPNSAALRKLTLEAIQNSYHRPKLSSVQAILLFLQCQPEDPLNPDHTFDWGLTCQALAIAQCIGLHLDSTNWALPKPEKNVMKRLAWALYMQDRWTALAYGRPVHIHEDDWAIADLVDADFADGDNRSPEEERRSMLVTGKQQFMQMVELSRLLSTILSDFYTAKTSSEQDTLLLYTRAKPTFEALDQWSQAVPPSLGMHIIYQRRLSFHGYLHFSYYGVQMALLRRLIRSTVLGPQCSNHEVLSELRQRALQISQSAITLVAGLRPDQLEAFWYFTAPYLFSLLGSFITLLLVTSLSSQERTFWQETLNSYLWNSRTMSKSSEPMQYAANRLEGAILRGLEHALAVNLMEPQDDTTSPPLAQTGMEIQEFMDFGDWDLFTAGGGSFDWLSVAANDHHYYSGTGSLT